MRTGIDSGHPIDNCLSERMAFWLVEKGEMALFSDKGLKTVSIFV